MTKMYRPAAFPKAIFITIDEGEDKPIFIASESPVEVAEVGSNVRVGVYELTHTGEVSTVAELKVEKI